MFRFLILSLFLIFTVSCSSSKKTVIPLPAVHPKRLAVLIAYDYNNKPMSDIASGIADVLEQHQKLKKADILFFSMSIENEDFDVCEKKMNQELEAAFFNPDAILFIGLMEGMSERRVRAHGMLGYGPSDQTRESDERLKRTNNARKDGQHLAFALSSKLRLE
jgi:hypothetical protein